MKEIEKILAIIAKDSTTDSISRMTKLTKDTNACVRLDGESLKYFIERFTLPAASYLNMINADQNSAESQNFAITMISNGNLPSQVFTKVMSTLVIKEISKEHNQASTVSVQASRI